MAKVQSFSDKVAKAQSQKGLICPVCEQLVSYIKVVAPVQTDSGSFRFRTRMDKVCKCTGSDGSGK